MRLAWLVVLAGCDLVFKVNTEPAGSDPDAAGDAGCGLPPGFDESLTAGKWFSADRAAGHALKILTGTLEETLGDVDTNQPNAYTTVGFPNGASFPVIDAPRLSPGGNELMLLATSAVGSPVLATAQRVAGAWGALSQLTLVGAEISLTTDTSAGPPTNTNPRRMIASVSGGLVELEEVTAGTWMEIHYYPPAGFGLSFITQGMLTPDGSRLVFLGTSGAGSTLAAYVADRTDLAAMFGSAVVLYGGPPVPELPFYAADCREHLYITVAGTIHHIIL